MLGISELRNAANKTKREGENRQRDTCPLWKILLNPS